MNDMTVKRILACLGATLVAFGTVGLGSAHGKDVEKKTFVRCLEA